MLLIKGNRIHTASFSFELPQGLSIITDPTNVKTDILTFETLDGRFVLDIGASDYNKAPIEQIERLKNDKEVMILSDIKPITRGKMKGYGLFFSGVEWRYMYYEEFLEYPINEEGQAAFRFCVEYEREGDDTIQVIEDFLNLSNIKAFMDSIGD